MDQIEAFKLHIPQIEKTLGYVFQNKSLLLQAFTRSSYVNERLQEKKPIETQSNEVLEYMGDSVLSCVLSYHLLLQKGKISADYGFASIFEEGDFTVIKHNLTNKAALGIACRKLGLEKYLILNTGDRNQGHFEEQDSPCEDLFESILGAIALDSSMNLGLLYPLIMRLCDVDALMTVARARDAKSTIKEYCEKMSFEYAYDVVEKIGPDHAPTYRVKLTISGVGAYFGEGPSIKKAEQAAAEEARTELHL